MSTIVLPRASDAAGKRAGSRTFPQGFPQLDLFRRITPVEGEEEPKETLFGVEKALRAFGSPDSARVGPAGEDGAQGPGVTPAVA